MHSCSDMRPASASSSAALLDFFKLIFKLKQTPRTGWVLKGIPANEAESIAEHMYRMAMISMVLPMAEGVSREKCIMIALVHDLAEAIVGDLTPDCGVSSEEKHRREASALVEMTKDLSPEIAQLIRGLWKEYESGSSEEGRIVKQIDKFEFALQASEYEKIYPEVDCLDQWIKQVEPVVKDEHLKGVYDLMCSQRH